MANALQMRMKIGRYFLDLVNRKISGELSTEEFEKRTAQRRMAEQLSLGIGAATEGAGQGPTRDDVKAMERIH